jgi:hypothetical protein
MPFDFEPEDYTRVWQVITTACKELGLTVDYEGGPTNTLLEALGFHPGESTLQLLAAVDVDGISPRDITTLEAISSDTRCLKIISGVRITRDLLDLLAFPTIRAGITRRIVEEVAAPEWTEEPTGDLYAQALTMAGAVDAGLLKVDVIDSLEDLQILARHAEQALATAENRFPPPPFPVPPNWHLLDTGEMLTAALKAADPDDDFNELPWSQADLAGGRMFYLRSPQGDVWTLACRSC